MKSELQKTIITDRFYLQPLTVNEVGCTYISWLNNQEVNRYLECRYHEHTIESTLRYVKDCSQNPSILNLAIFDKNNDLHIGNIKLEVLDNDQKQGELGILIGEQSYWGRGVATEVIKEVVKFGFHELRLHKIGAGCYQSNIASRIAFEKSGFSVTGFLEGSHEVNGVSENSYYLTLNHRDYFS